MNRRLSRTAYLGLKGAFRNLVDLCGGLECAANDSRAQKSSLSNYGSINHEALFTPIDVVADLESAVGDPVVTRMLAKLMGYELTAVEPGADGADFRAHDPLVMAGKIAVALSDLTEEAIAAQADGHLTDGEIDQLVMTAEGVVVHARKAHDALCRLQATRKTGRAA